MSKPFLTPTEDSLDGFKTAMAEVGFQIDQPIADGQIHRFDIDKTGNKVGWYVLFDGDFPAGVAGSWVTGERVNWASRNPQKMTKSGRTEYRQKLDLAKKLSEEDLKKRHAEAKDRAMKIWEKAKLAAGDHPYLKKNRSRASG